MLRAFHDLVTDETAEAPRMLGDLRMMQGVRKFPQRVKCAMLAWRAVEQALLQSAGEATISTETDFAVPRYPGLPDSAAPIGKNAA
jgi:nitrogen fixation NifU-like protein